MKILEVRFEDDGYISIQRFNLKGGRIGTTGYPYFQGVDRLCEETAYNCSNWTRECLGKREEKTYKMTDTNLDEFCHKLVESGDFAAPYAISQIKRFFQEYEDKGQET